jgi:hypothetical protein
LRPMTIRKSIKRLFFNLLLNILVLFVALQLLGFCVQLWPQVFAAVPWVYWVAAAALWLTMAWFAIKLVRIPCPRCLKSLGGAALAAVVGIETINKCPHCRVSFDEPVEARGPN